MSKPRLEEILIGGGRPKKGATVVVNAREEVVPEAIREIMQSGEQAKV